LDYLDPIPPLAPVLLPPEAPAPVDDRKNAVVDLLDVLLLVCAAGVGFIVCAIVLGVFLVIRYGPTTISSPGFKNSLEHNVLFLIPAQLLIYVVVVGAMGLLVWARHNTSLGRAIRWNRPTLNHALLAVFGGAALAFLADMTEFLLQRWIPKSLPITELFKDRSSAFALAAFGIMVAPLVEELFFRGFLYPALSRWTGVAPAVTVTGAAFALIHASQLAHAWAPLLVLFVVGSVLTAVRAVSKSVAVCVLIHMAYNFTIFTQLYIGSHGFRDL
jgi:membrane protease YdiL (CAAX protease family)